MINFLLTLLLSAHAASVEKLTRAGITVPATTGAWKKMKSLPAFGLSDFDLVLENTKNPANKRFISTQFAATTGVCQGEFESLKKAGFKIITESKSDWACIIKAESGPDRRFLAVKEIKRTAGKRPVFISQVLLVEMGAGAFSDFDTWLDSAKVIK